MWIYIVYTHANTQHTYVLCTYTQRERVKERYSPGFPALLDCLLFTYHGSTLHLV